MLVNAIGGIAGSATFTIWIAALVVTRFGQIGEFIGETAAPFLQTGLGQPKTRAARFAGLCRLHEPCFRKMDKQRVDLHRIETDPAGEIIGRSVLGEPFPV